MRTATFDTPTAGPISCVPSPVSRLAKPLQILVLVPETMRARCFSPRDLDRLRLRHTLLTPGTDDPAELVEVFRENAGTLDVVITGWDSPPITDELLDRAPNLRAIVHAAGSVKPFIPASIWERNIRLGSANDALGVGVAETTLGMIIAGLKGFFPCSEITRNGGWQAEFMTHPTFQTREIYEVTVGIIGASRVGRHVIRLLKAFEVDVLLTDPHVNEEEADRLGVERVSLGDLMARSDVISLHAPALESTRNMLGRREFRAMKDGAILVNTARGMIVDEEALVEELQTLRISAFLDVTSPEPPALDHPFRSLPNVVLTPHIAGALTNGCLRMGRSAVEQTLEFASGGVMHGEITATRLEQLA